MSQPISCIYVGQCLTKLHCDYGIEGVGAGQGETIGPCTRGHSPKALLAANGTYVCRLDKEVYRFSREAAPGNHGSRSGERISQSPGFGPQCRGVYAKPSV